MISGSTPGSERKETLRGAIADEEERLRELEPAQEAVRGRLASLRSELDALEAAPLPAREAPASFGSSTMTAEFLAMPVSWKGTLVQYTGGLHRQHPGKAEVRLYDYVDRDVPILLRMFEKRLRGYRAIGYARGEAPLGFAEPGGETTIDYDEEAGVNDEDAFA